MEEYTLQAKQITDLAREIRAFLQTIYSEREAAGMAWIILEHVTANRRAQLMTQAEASLTAEQHDAAENIVVRLMKGQPLQYVLGETHFYGLKLKVAPSVLIPRQETEELVDWITRKAGDKAEDILDIGTGSGCIAIALSKNLPQARVWACDISEKALELARENARLNQAEISFKQADILDEASPEAFPPFDIIVSNPPYVTDSEKKSMAANVLDHEPHLALFVEDSDPLCFYRAIAAFALRKLRPGGQLYFEINEAFGLQVLALLRQSGFQHVELRKDLNGKDRMVRAVF